MITLPFGKYKDNNIEIVPDTYLDHLLGEDWFIEQERNKELVQQIEKELETRKRSDAYVVDEWGKILEDL